MNAGVTQILQRGFHPLGAAGVAAGFLDLGHAAEFLMRPAAGAGFAQAFTPECRDAFLEMEAQLSVELLFQSLAIAQTAPPVHADTSVFYL